MLCVTLPVENGEGPGKVFCWVSKMAQWVRTLTTKLTT